jgi:hypothetical protein
MISEKFNYDNEKIIKEFTSKVVNTKNYDFCQKLKRKFSNKNIYELITLPSDKLDETLEKMLTKKEYELYIAYKKTHLKFNLNEFINYIDELVELNSPKITVYVGSKQENYDYMNKYIKTKVDGNIYRGLKIKYQGKMYDFSLSGKDL